MPKDRSVKEQLICPLTDIQSVERHIEGIRIVFHDKIIRIARILIQSGKCSFIVRRPANLRMMQFLLN